MLMIRSNPYLLPGQVALVKDGNVVWVGPLGAPWEDAVCDTVVMSQRDYDATVLRTLPDGRKIP